MTGRRIAVIGGGISGLTAGYVLSRTDHVTLFEADPRLGGHADTHLVGPVPVDTGFIVYNERTYPLLTRLFAELGVSTRAAEMSMSVRCAGCGLCYAGKRGPGGLAAGLRRGGGRFLRLLADVPRFHRAARALLNDPADGPGDATFGEFLDHGGYSGYFQAHFALPLVAAVWSCPAGTAQEYPARYLFAFLANHGMLSISGSPPWRTVAGGSRCYVERAAARLARVRARRPGPRRAPLPGRRRGARRLGPGVPVRRGGHRHPPGPGPRAARPGHRGRTRGARRLPLHPEPGPAAHRRPAAPGPPRGPGLLELRARPLPGTERRGSATT